ncbi:MAG TPA: hypothetical protein VK922_13160 [Gemmatimonadaceae bacterium]|nr:hypothetical protein [Gemmatimonadaceae bacterium]
MSRAGTSILTIALAALPAASLLPLRFSATLGAADELCSLQPAPTIALLRVERDTTLPYTPVRATPMSYSGVRQGPADSMLVAPGDPMPAARVRMLRMDTLTRQSLTAAGVTDSLPAAFITAAPYRADCRTIRYSDSIPFVVPGDVGFVRASLSPSEHWIDGTPVFVIRPVWHYPYPYRRALAFAATPDAHLASAEAMYGLTLTLEMPHRLDADARTEAGRARQNRARAWARENGAAAELEPARSMIRRAVLESDWEAARRIPSRLRGTYRVELALGGTRGTWFFRTHDKPGYRWDRADSLQSIAALVESPHIPGYRLAGLGAASMDSLPTAYPRGGVRGPLVWLGSSDRPTIRGDDSLLTLDGELMFQLGAAPEWLWTALEDLVPPPNARDSALMAGLNLPLERARLQPRIPLTLHLGALGGVRADTTLSIRGGPLRVILERVDTAALARPF